MSPTSIASSRQAAYRCLPDGEHMLECIMFYGPAEFHRHSFTGHEDALPELFSAGTVSGIKVQRLLKQPGEFVIDIRHHGAQWHPVGRGIGRTPGEQVPSTGGQGVDIPGGFQFQGSRKVACFRCTETLGAMAPRNLTHFPMRTKVPQLRFPLGSKQDVSRAQVTVGHPLAVQECQGPGNRGDNRNGLPHAQWTSHRHDLSSRSCRTIFHQYSLAHGGFQPAERLHQKLVPYL